VETVDALAQALLDYEGTVIFTSHDRSFMKTVATNVVEVKDGRVMNYLGDYGAYLAAVTREIDDAEAGDERRRGNSAARKPAAPTPSARKASARTERDVRKEISNLERTIARLDAEKRGHNEALLAATDPAEALRLHTAMTEVAEKLAAAEERWLALQGELEESS
jgi:ATP-binding cassette subfamily F protein 3